MYRHISRLHLKQQLNSDFVCTVTSEYTEIVSLPEYIHKYIHNVEASFLLGGLEVAGTVPAVRLPFFFFGSQKLYFREPPTEPLSPSAPKSCNHSNSLSLFSQLGAPRILFSSRFPADSLAVNGSYSQYGLMMGVSG